MRDNQFNTSTELQRLKKIIRRRRFDLVERITNEIGAIVDELMEREGVEYGANYPHFVDEGIEEICQILKEEL